MRNFLHFHECKGIQIILELIKKRVGEDKAVELVCSFSMLLDLLDLIAIALNSIKLDNSKPLSQDILQSFYERLSQLTDKDIKDLQRQSFDRIYSILDSLLLIKDPSTRSKDGILELILGLAIKLIKSQYITKKLMGISLIQDMIPKTALDKRFMFDKDLITLEWKDQNMLAKKLNENSLVEIILGENVQAEIVKKAEDLFSFLIKNNCFDSKYIHLIWNCCIEKHEDIMKACLELLSNMAAKLQLSHLQEVYQLIEALNFNSYTETMIIFIENYTLNVLERFKKVQNAPNSVAKNPYNMDIFWKLMIDNVAVNGNIKEAAMKSLIRIMNKHIDFVDMFIQKAVLSIKEEQNVLRCCLFLKQTDFASYVMGKGMNARKAYDLRAMNKSNSIIKNLLNDCTKYHTNVRKENENIQKEVKDILNKVI